MRETSLRRSEPASAGCVYKVYRHWEDRTHAATAPPQTRDPARGRGVTAAYSTFNRRGEGSNPSDPTAFTEGQANRRWHPARNGTRPQALEGSTPSPSARHPWLWHGLPTVPPHWNWGVRLLARSPVFQAGQMGSKPIRPAHGRVAEWQTRQAQNLVFPKGTCRFKSGLGYCVQAPVVKRTSCDASNVEVRVRLLVGVLKHPQGVLERTGPCEGPGRGSTPRGDTGQDVVQPGVAAWLGITRTQVQILPS